MASRPIVAAYYFPNWHVDPRNEALHGRNWTEWRVTQYATPRFPGHAQPKVPLWGYEDEADPAVMAKKIKTAATYGIDAFIFDWYYFFDGSYRERCLREGFLGAENRHDIDFALMWANHLPIYAHPGSYWKPGEPLWSSDYKPETFIACTNHCIEHYFAQPNYLRINGGLYFSIYAVRELVKNLGGLDVAKVLFRDFRHRVEQAGLGRLTLDGRVGSLADWHDFAAANQLAQELGLDTCSNYNWVHKSGAFPAMEYAEWFDYNRQEPEIISRNMGIPYNPALSVGWDSSPRTVQSDMYDKQHFPFTAVVTNNTPALFEEALRSTAAAAYTGSMILIGSWNEWTEGSYLEPDEEFGYGRLEAIQRVFGPRRRDRRPSA